MSHLLHELRQFTGSEQFYKNPLFKEFIYTEGIKYLANGIADGSIEVP